MENLRVDVPSARHIRENKLEKRGANKSDGDELFQAIDH